MANVNIGTKCHQKQEQCLNAWFLPMTCICNCGRCNLHHLNVDDKLWIDIREPREDIWIKVHQEQLVSGRWLNSFARELMVKITHISWTFLKMQTDYELDISVSITVHIAVQHTNAVTISINSEPAVSLHQYHGLQIIHLLWLAIVLPFQLCINYTALQFRGISLLRGHAYNGVKPATFWLQVQHQTPQCHLIYTQQKALNNK